MQAEQTLSHFAEWVTQSQKSESGAGQFNGLSIPWVDFAHHLKNVSDFVNFAIGRRRHCATMALSRLGIVLGQGRRANHRVTARQLQYVLDGTETNDSSDKKRLKLFGLHSPEYRDQC